MNSEELRNTILDLTEEYCAGSHAPEEFVPGKRPVPVSGRVYGAREMRSLVDSALDFWLTTGRFNEAFEDRLSEYIGVQYASTANSGSSANLLAVAALTSSHLGDRALKPHDEVITTAVNFPTTVNPLLLYGLLPVFVDVHVPTYNALAGDVEKAITKKTRAIILAHTLGNPFEVEKVTALAQKHNLWLIEDCCDALGSVYGERKVGTYGHLGTFSFYPAHHITMGEGGAVCTSNPRLQRIVESFRDWGRDCWCATGQDNTCEKRFGWQLGSLPKGYDHKYIYSHAGYNLKITDMQAAVGLAQMDRVEEFVEARRRNFNFLLSQLKAEEEHFILPEATPNSEPSWFGFPLTLRTGCPFTREDLLRWLNDRKIGTRLVFAGNIIRQPYFANRPHRVSGSLENTDTVMRDTFWLGVYPGLTQEMLAYVVQSVHEFLETVCERKKS